MDDHERELRFLLARDASLRERAELLDEQLAASDLKLANSLDVVISQLRVRAFPVELHASIADQLDQLERPGFEARVSEIRRLIAEH